MMKPLRQHLTLPSQHQGFSAVPPSIKISFLSGPLPKASSSPRNPLSAAACHQKSWKKTAVEKAHQPGRSWQGMHLLVHSQSRPMPLRLQSYNLRQSGFSNSIAGAPLRHLRFSLYSGAGRSTVVKVVVQVVSCSVPQMKILFRFI